VVQKWVRPKKRRLYFRYLNISLKCVVIYFSGTCNFDYDFIVHQENANVENSFILAAMKAKNKVPAIHIAGKYNGSVSTDSMLEPYRNISIAVMERIYRNYYT